MDKLSESDYSVDLIDLEGNCDYLEDDSGRPYRRYKRIIHKKYPSPAFDNWIVKYGISQIMISSIVCELKKTYDIKWRIMLYALFEKYMNQFLNMNLSSCFLLFAKNNLIDLILYMHLFGARAKNPMFLNKINNVAQLNHFKEYGYDVDKYIEKLNIKNGNYENIAKLLSDKNKTQSNVFELLTQCNIDIFQKFYNNVLMVQKPPSVKKNINNALMDFSCNNIVFSVVIYLLKLGIDMTHDQFLVCIGLTKLKKIKKNKKSKSKSFDKWNMSHYYNNRYRRRYDSHLNTINKKYKVNKNAIGKNNTESLCEIIKLYRQKTAIDFPHIKSYAKWLLVKNLKVGIEIMNSFTAEQHKRYSVKLPDHELYRLIDTDDVELLKNAISSKVINLIKFQKINYYVVYAVHNYKFKIAEYLMDVLKMKYMPLFVSHYIISWTLSKKRATECINFIHKKLGNVPKKILDCLLKYGCYKAICHYCDIEKYTLSEHDIFKMINPTAANGNSNFIKCAKKIIKRTKKPNSIFRRILTQTKTFDYLPPRKMLYDFIMSSAQKYNFELNHYDKLFFENMNCHLLERVYSDTKNAKRINIDLIQIIFNYFENPESYIEPIDGHRYRYRSKIGTYKLNTAKQNEQPYQRSIFNIILFLKKIVPDLVQQITKKYTAELLSNIYSKYIHNIFGMYTPNDFIEFFDNEFKFVPTNEHIIDIIKTKTFDYTNSLYAILKKYAQISNSSNELIELLMRIYPSEETLDFLESCKVDILKFMTPAYINELFIERGDSKVKFIKMCIDKSNYKATPYLYKIFTRNTYSNPRHIERWITNVKDVMRQENSFVPIVSATYEKILNMADRCGYKNNILDLNIPVVNEYIPTDDEKIIENFEGVDFDFFENQILDHPMEVNSINDDIETIDNDIESISNNSDENK